MSRLDRLPTLGRMYPLPKEGQGLPPMPQPLTQKATGELTFEQKYAPYPPFSSSEEVYAHQWLIRRDPYWIPQVPIAYGGARGGTTSIDEYHPLKKLAVFWDGSFVHGFRHAYDMYLRAALLTRGLTVLAMSFTTSEDFVRKLPAWYMEEIG